MLKKQAAVLFVALCFLAGAAWAADETKVAVQAVKIEASSRVNDGVRQAWQSLYKAKYTPDEENCYFDYGPGGMRNLACYLVSVIKYQDLVSWAGMAPFKSGPHTATALDLHNPYDFGRYNPEFIRWMADNLIPAEKDESFRWVTQPVYNKLFRDTARAYYLAWVEAKSKAGWLDREARRLEEDINNEVLDEYWFLQYEPLAEAQIEQLFNGDYYFMNVGACASAFWIRRHTDGTDEEFAKGLTRLLKTYDGQFLDSAAKAAGPGQESLPSGAEINFNVGDPLLLKFLEGLGQAAVDHKWDIVLTHFDPQNFQAQTNMGLSKPQYLEEGLGLGFVNNSLIPAPGDDTPYARLNSIRAVRFNESIKAGPDSLSITGEVVLFNGETRQLVIFIRKTVTGTYLIEPGVG